MVDTWDNPVKVVRSSLGLSMRKTAKAVGCHYQTIFQSEHGMFNALPPVMVDWIVANSDYSRVDVAINYSNFQTRKRKDSAEQYATESLTVACLGTPESHPVVSLREHLGLTLGDFCKAFCIPMPWVYNSENQDQTLSPRMKSALRWAYVPASVINEIEERFEVLYYAYF